MHEASLHESNAFITLTYDDEHVPSDYSLRYGDFQKFMKRLRKHVHAEQSSSSECASSGRTGRGVRFYMCGEYGERLYRPHFHACIFGYGFPDRTLFAASGSGHDVFRSAALERLWPFGFSSIGEVTFESAAYVARYVMKKVTGTAAEDHYMRVLEETGELVSVVPEFTHMSLKPGIGADWFAKYRKEIAVGDYVIVNGQKVKPPKYYDRLTKEVDPETFERFEFLRYQTGVKYAEDATPERLVAREKVTRARLAFKRRSLE